MYNASSTKLTISAPLMMRVLLSSPCRLLLAARLLIQCSLFQPVKKSALLHRLNLSTPFSRRKLKHMMLAHSLHYTHAPNHTVSILTPTAPLLTYTIRQRHYYSLPNETRALQGVNILKSQACLNSLPISIAHIKSSDTFKKEATPLILSSVCCCIQKWMLYS